MNILEEDRKNYLYVIRNHESLQKLNDAMRHLNQTIVKQKVGSVE